MASDDAAYTLPWTEAFQPQQYNDNSYAAMRAARGLNERLTPVEAQLADLASRVVELENAKSAPAVTPKGSK